MKITKNIYLDNLLYNSIALVPFLIGVLYHSEGALTFGLAVYWVLSIIGILAIFFSSEIWQKILQTKITEGENIDDIEIVQKSYNYNYINFNIVYDVAIIIMLISYNFGLLAFAYLVHMFGGYQMWVGVREACQAIKANPASTEINTNKENL